jgi:tryptophan synthase alpha chain
MLRSQENNRLIKKFQQLSEKNERALICYTIAGYPDIKTTEDIVSTIVSAGGDIIEIGIPFSDPIADGPIIQEASYQTLVKGITPEKCLTIVSNIRRKHSTLPILAMTYSNILLHNGFLNFMTMAKEKGIDGFILPDMAIEESGTYVDTASKLGLSTIFMVSPNTSSTRIESIINRSSGFLYLVSVYGITGVRRSVEGYTLEAIKKVKQISQAKIPVAVGFGISNPSQAKMMINAGADAIILGTSIINKIKHSPDKKKMLQDLHSFITSMKKACK